MGENKLLLQLSKESIALAEEKARENNWPDIKMLEWMVQSFASSTKEEIEGRKNLKKEAWFDFRGET